MQRGNLVLESEHNGISVVEVFGVYYISVNGRHRVAALKAMCDNQGTVIARVEHCPVSSSTIIGRSDNGSVRFLGGRFQLSNRALTQAADCVNGIAQLEDRRKRGLWQGRLVECIFARQPNFIEKHWIGAKVACATWDIDSVAHPFILHPNEAEGDRLAKKLGF